jgi:hypothetical protein
VNTSNQTFLLIEESLELSGFYLENNKQLLLSKVHLKWRESQQAKKQQQGEFDCDRSKTSRLFSPTPH